MRSSKVARSTFCQGAKSNPEKAKKEPNSKIWSEKGPRPDPCGSEQPIHRERPVATQHPRAQLC